MNEEIKNIKQKYTKNATARNTFLNNKNKLNGKAQTFENETEKKVNAINYYNSLTDLQKKQFNEELKKKEIRENYLKYLKYIYGDNYILTRFHTMLGKLCESIVKRVEKGEKVKICISVQPQVGKSSTITETLPSWFLGRNPDLRCIITGYNADMAEKFGDRNRQKIKQYGKDIFGVEVSDSQDNKTLWDIKNHLGGVVSTGINGSLTGNQGALIIVDDPFKNEIEANTQSIRDMVWSNFTSAILTRMRGKGNAIIVIHTRWHEDDLIGRIKKCETADEWVFVDIPCVWEKGEDKLLHRHIGETLCPEIGFDSKWAESIQKTIGKRQWSALYQQHPYIESGEIVKREDIMTYSIKTKPASFEEIVLSCDLSFGGTKTENDPCCLTVFGRNGGNHYILEVVKKKMTFTQTLERIKYLCGKYPTMNKKIVEKKANGNATIETLSREIGGFVPFDPKANSKQERLELVLPYLEGHNVFFPDETIDKDMEDNIEELLKFPKGTHDDFVDTLTQYLLNYSYKYSGGCIGTNSMFANISKIIRGFGND